MAKFILKKHAIELRKQGKSIRNIANILTLSKSTVSDWCRSILLTEKQKNMLIKQGIDGRNRGRMIGAEMNRKKKESRVNFFRQEALDTFKSLSDREIELISAALYWAEGAKTDSRFMFVNSDPTMIKLLYLYMVNVMKVAKNRIRPVVQINEIHRTRIHKVLKFWSNLLELPTDYFGNTYYIKTVHKKVYDNHDSYYGILRMRITKSSDYQYKMLGIINAIICRGSSGG